MTDYGRDWEDGIGGRLLRYVDFTDAGCWEWTVSKKKGYGQIRIGGRLGSTPAVHRLAYEEWVGPIPAGLTLDHLCRNRACFNPWHLEPVPNRENILRGISPAALAAKATHCPKGHPYDEVNTYRNPTTGDRLCRECNRQKGNLHYASLTPEQKEIRRIYCRETTGRYRKKKKGQQEK